MPLKKKWSFLPQTIQKKKTLVFEPKPRRCHFCKSNAVRFSSFTGLSIHTQVHKLVDKEDFTKLEPPSARPGKTVSFTVKSEWNKLRAEHSKKKSQKMTDSQVISRVNKISSWDGLQNDGVKENRVPQSGFEMRCFLFAMRTCLLDLIRQTKSNLVLDGATISWTEKDSVYAEGLTKRRQAYLRDCI